MTTLRLEIPDPGVGWLTANQRLHWAQRSRHTRAWREATAWRAKALKLPPQAGRVHILAEVRFKRGHHRDVGNWYPTVKACVDGCVDAGVLADDDVKHVDGPDLRVGQPHPVGAVLLTITPLPAEDRTAAGRRCGNCFHRRTLAWRARSYPKCCFPEGEGPEDLELLGPPRASHGAATDCRSWWPGCVDHVYGEPSLSPDAARWVPEATA